MIETSGTERPGGRTARTREAVHAAVRAVIEESGPGAVTIPEVARRAGVHPTTVYRRWQTAEALLLDVTAGDVAAESPLRVTGDLRADVLAYARSLVNGLAAPGGLTVWHALLSTASSHPGGLEAARTFAEPRAAQFEAMLQASDSRELTVDDVFELVLAPIFMWATLGAISEAQAPNSERGLERIADNLVAVRDHRRSRHERDA